ncbi:hypothetical protein ACFY7C_21060 [Streptomyces sp. NPDC012769]|uniref:hypothetical protein n=1 Tax=Streptomyces sp. NPDC012769 TaxID=3364848 RepID=UPI0036BBC0D5
MQIQFITATPDHLKLRLPWKTAIKASVVEKIEEGAQFELVLKLGLAKLLNGLSELHRRLTAESWDPHLRSPSIMP